LLENSALIKSGCPCASDTNLSLNQSAKSKSEELNVRISSPSKNKKQIKQHENNNNELFSKTALYHKHGGHVHSHAHNNHSHSHKDFHIYKTQREKAHHDHHKKHEKEITDIKLIAWMVIMGDGLHNFADGLAIGISFAASQSIGFGTSLAVLCHELPHEIGDFAVLRRAGVSLKKALVFNAVSGLICLFGVGLGFWLASYTAIVNYLFLGIAGTFLYISLVDMVIFFHDLI
jgi:zinc transporter 6